MKWTDPAESTYQLFITGIVARMPGIPAAGRNALQREPLQDKISLTGKFFIPAGLIVGAEPHANRLCQFVLVVFPHSKV